MREIPERPQISMHEDLLEPSLGEAALVIRTIISNPSATPPPPAAAFVPPQTTLDMVSQAFQRTERDNSSNCDRGFDHVKAYIEEYKEGDGYPEWVSRVCIKTLNSLKSLKPEDLSCHDLDAIGTIEKIAAILVSREQFAEAEWLYRKIMSMRDLYKSQRFRGKLVIQFATMLTHTGDYKAAIEVCEELVRDWSLEHHTDIDGPVEYLSALYHQFSKKSEQERRILPLHRALELGCPQLLAAVLDNFPEDAAALDAKDAQGQTNLHLIAKSTHEDSIYFAKRLLDLGASIDARDERERTPLFIATFHGMKTMVGFFLERGADIIAEAQIECVFNKHGVWNPSAQMYCGSILLGPWVSTPLHVAIITHLDAIALRMLNGVPNIENVPNAEAALVCASLMGHYKVVELLLDKGLDVNSLSAVKYNHDDYQVTVDCAFMGSLCGGHRHLSRFLLERGANMENTSLKSCEALWFAVEHEWEDLLELLLVKGAGIDDFQYRFGHYRCETALQHACGQGWIRGVRQLIDKGADPNREAYRLQGRTALQAACDRAHEPLVTMLLQLGVDVNARPALDGGMTALQAACNAYEEGSEFIIRTLLRLGANINAPASGHGGMTALQAACSEGHESLVRMLLVNGADVNAPPSSEKGFTAIQVARRFNHSKIIDLLKVVGAVEESILVVAQSSNELL
ncbi:ankyrin repeat-containing domain protein [Trichophaea hybrida]|nr:ankyrin repeat-containing domain protein [Trichophaea hybrida]